MNEADMFKLAQELDEECKPDEVYAQELEAENGCEDEEEGFDVNFFKGASCEKVEKTNAPHSVTIKNKKTKANNDKFKDAYFSYYDDIKIPSHKVTDW